MEAVEGGTVLHATVLRATVLTVATDPRKQEAPAAADANWAKRAHPHTTTMHATVGTDPTPKPGKGLADG